MACVCSNVRRSFLHLCCWETNQSIKWTRSYLYYLLALILTHKVFDYDVQSHHTEKSEIYSGKNKHDENVKDNTNEKKMFVQLKIVSVLPI